MLRFSLVVCNVPLGLVFGFVLIIKCYVREGLLPAIEKTDGQESGYVHIGLSRRMQKFCRVLHEEHEVSILSSHVNGFTVSYDKPLTK